MFLRSIGLALLLASAPASAGVQLWGQVEAGMPFEQAKALFPNAHVHTGKGLARPMIRIDDYEVDEGCDASVWILIDRKVADPEAKVESVQMFGSGCDSRMLTALVARYGEPSNSSDNPIRRTKTVRWFDDGKAIVYKSEEGKGFASDTWEITYSPVKDLGL